MFRQLDTVRIAERAKYIQDKDLQFVFDFLRISQNNISLQLNTIERKLDKIEKIVKEVKNGNN